MPPEGLSRHAGRGLSAQRPSRGSGQDHGRRAPALVLRAPDAVASADKGREVSTMRLKALIVLLLLFSWADRPPSVPRSSCRPRRDPPARTATELRPRGRRERALHRRPHPLLLVASLPASAGSRGPRPLAARRPPQVQGHRRHSSLPSPRQRGSRGPRPQVGPVQGPWNSLGSPPPHGPVGNPYPALSRSWPSAARPLGGRWSSSGPTRASPRPLMRHRVRSDLRSVCRHHPHRHGSDPPSPLRR